MGEEPNHRTGRKPDPLPSTLKNVSIFFDDKLMKIQVLFEVRLCTCSVIAEVQRKFVGFFRF